MTKPWVVTVEGKEYDVDAPDERTAWRWANVSHRQRVKNLQTPEFEKEAARTLESSLPERIAANPIVRTLTSAAKPILGAAGLVENLWGGTSNRDRIQQLEGMQQRGNEALGFGHAGTAADISGGVLSPVGLGALKIPAAASTAGRIAQGSGIGAVAGLTAGTDDPLASGGTGAVIGAAIPGAIEGAKAGGRLLRNIADPLFPGGIDRVAGRTLNTAAGDKQKEIIAALRKNEQIVPGSMPTAGEAASPVGRAEFSGVEALVKGRTPSAYNDTAQAQNAARVAELRTVGRTPAELSSAEGRRSADALRNYGNAYSQAIKGDPQLLQMAENPFFKEALADASRLAKANNVDPKTNLTQYLHYVKVSLDKQLSKTGDTALANTERQAVQEAKSKLVAWLGQKNPAYETARSEFAAASKPINQMEIGQYLEQKLVPALSDEAPQKAAAYAQALRDAPGTIKRATGQPRFDDMSQMLTPEQVRATQSVGRDLGRSAENQRLGKLGREEAGRIIGDVDLGKLPNALHRPIMVINAALNRMSGKLTEKSAIRLSEVLRDPKLAAKVMEGATASERAQLAKALLSSPGSRLATVVGAQGASN